MNDLRKYITILESVSNDELQKYRDEVKYWQNEREKYWPVSPELMAQYKDGTHTRKNSAGDLYWRNQNGQWHRDGDKPAIIYADSRLEWWQNDKFHRDGDKPAIIMPNGGLRWLQNDKFHRDGDKPAIIGGDGSLEWYQNDQRHRSRGPAIIISGSIPQWYWRGAYIPAKSQEEFIEYLKKHKGVKIIKINK